MLNSADIRKSIIEKEAEVKALFELAAAEKRELTADEKTVVDRVQGIGNEPGELQALGKDLERAIKFEERKSVIAAELGGRLGKPQAPNRQTKAIVVPAKARNCGSLKAYSGEKAEESAYVFGRVMAANFFNHGKSRQWLKEHGIRNSVSTDSNESGAIFIPVETSREIIRLVEQYGMFRGQAKKEPMGSDRKVVPVRTGGMTAYPVAETTTANEGSNTGTKSQPSYTNVELVARKWKAWFKMSDEFSEDALISMADEAVTECALAFAYAEDNAGWNGDASSAYHSITGVLNAVNAGSIFTATAGNLAFSTLDLQDFLTMQGKLPAFPGIRPAWFISQEGYSDSIARLQLAAGGNAAADMAAGGLPRFLGAPVVITNVLNTTLSNQASTKLLAYGDLRMAALFGDRRKMTMSLTDQRFWDEDQIAIKATERFDIKIHSKGTATVAGAILVLQTPAS